MTGIQVPSVQLFLRNKKQANERKRENNWKQSVNPNGEDFWWAKEYNRRMQQQDNAKHEAALFWEEKGRQAECCKQILPGGVEINADQRQ